MEIGDESKDAQSLGGEGGKLHHYAKIIAQPKFWQLWGGGIKWLHSFSAKAPCVANWLHTPKP
jgi:hypothetical protein